MSNLPLVSIIVNCYNSEKYLKETIDSVLLQTHSNWELIFWDNQSTDNSAEIVKCYKDERIRYFYAEKHTSLGEGRNLALEKVKGEYVSFLDADDYYYPDKIAKTLEAFSSENVGLVYTNGHTLYQAENRFHTFYGDTAQDEGDLFQRWLNHYDVKIPSVMFRTSVIKAGGIHFDPRFSMVEEYDFFLQISRVSQCKYVEEELCIFRVYSTSLTSKSIGKWAGEYEQLAKKVSEYDKEADLSYLLSRSAVWRYKSALLVDNKIDRLPLESHCYKNKKVFLIYALSFLGVRINKMLYRISSGR
ncbi:glycosyltransferase family 2 protein [Vibrio caribbeanicus]|uniref:glycosyltransferase family 2 protein n=1 Tax=Vibrio caribbeanicus TaxID=701175 RepID=UPI0006897ADE|nr:glycosyltransferase [Vibrio caribbeanicus]